VLPNLAGGQEGDVGVLSSLAGVQEGEDWLLRGLGGGREVSLRSDSEESELPSDMLSVCLEGVRGATGKGTAGPPPRLESGREHTGTEGRMIKRIGGWSDVELLREVAAKR
jgi:hypothetical protein